MNRILAKGMSTLLAAVLASTLACAPAFADSAYTVGSLGPSGAAGDGNAAGNAAGDAAENAAGSAAESIAERVTAPEKPAGAQKAIAAQKSKKSKEKGWSADGKSYYRNGKKLTGLHKIKGSRYYFNSKGRLKTKDFTVNGITYYVRPSGKIFGAKLLDRYYYKTLKPMTDDDAYDFETYLMARSIVADITEAGDSRETKLWKSFCWVMNKDYAIHQDFNPYATNWPATYARFHFENRGGDCHSDGSAFGYLAAACGYDADVCIDSMSSGHVGSHCWTMIGNAVYDPLFYQSKGTMYYGATSGTYEVNPTARFRVPTFNPKNAAADAVPATELIQAGYSGLKKIGKNRYFFKGGKAIESKWKKVDGKRYYFGADGAAATGSVKVGRSYYVFNKKGVLQNSKEKGARLVKVGKETYRVNEKGKALGGWNSDKTMRFAKNGMLLTGIRVQGGAFFAASSKGIYDASLTGKLNEAAKSGSPAAVLYQLLGTPEHLYYSANCEGKGDDGLWEFKHFNVTTIRPTGADQVADAAAKLSEGGELAEPYEYVVGIEKR